MALRGHQIYSWLSAIALLVAFALPHAGEWVIDTCAPGYFSSVIIFSDREHLAAIDTAFKSAKAAIDPNARLGLLRSNQPEADENRRFDLDLTVYGPTPKAALEHIKAFVDHMNADLKRRDIPEVAPGRPSSPVSVYPPWGKFFLNVCDKLAWAFGLSSALLFFLACRHQAKREPPALPKEKEQSGFDY